MSPMKCTRKKNPPHHRELKAASAKKKRLDDAVIRAEAVFRYLEQIRDTAATRLVRLKRSRRKAVEEVEAMLVKISLSGRN